MEGGGGGVRQKVDGQPRPFFRDGQKLDQILMSNDRARHFISNSHPPSHIISCGGRMSGREILRRGPTSDVNIQPGRSVLEGQVRRTSSRGRYPVDVQSHY